MAQMFDSTLYTSLCTPYTLVTVHTLYTSIAQLWQEGFIVQVYNYKLSC